jgi:predicted pyridoxine 5'-phosphate oxidase superfamily flavin-nucleotide-binding protein
MPRRFAQLTFTDSVRAAQARYGTRAHNDRYEASEPANAELGAREREFIAARDSFYLATVSDTGWPYVQHRGGQPGFLKVLDARTLAFADFVGNLQYQSVGNLAHDGRVCLILVDYPRRRRLKLLGHARVIDLAELRERAPALLAQLRVDDAGATVERVLQIEVAAFDWNCARHITPRFTEREMPHALDPLRERIALLEARLRELGCELP